MVGGASDLVLFLRVRADQADLGHRVQGVSGPTSLAYPPATSLRAPPGPPVHTPRSLVSTCSSNSDQLHPPSHRIIIHGFPQTHSMLESSRSFVSSSPRLQHIGFGVFSLERILRTIPRRDVLQTPQRAGALPQHACPNSKHCILTQLHLPDQGGPAASPHPVFSVTSA